MELCSHPQAFGCLAQKMDVCGVKPPSEHPAGDEPQHTQFCNYTPLPKNPGHYGLTDLLQSIPTTHCNPKLALMKAGAAHTHLLCMSMIPQAPWFRRAPETRLLKFSQVRGKGRHATTEQS